MAVGEFNAKRDMAKAAIYDFIRAVAVCDMCTTPASEPEKLELTDDLYDLGWRVENDRLLCPCCTDNKR